MKNILTVVFFSLIYLSCKKETNNSASEHYNNKIQTSRSTDSLSVLRTRDCAKADLYVQPLPSSSYTVCAEFPSAKGMPNIQILASEIWGAVSPNGRYILEWGGGCLTLRSLQVLWNTPRAYNWLTPYNLEIQDDLNLVIYTQDRRGIWSSQTHIFSCTNNTQTKLVLTNDGELMIVQFTNDKNGNPTWRVFGSTDTKGGVISPHNGEFSRYWHY